VPLTPEQKDQKPTQMGHCGEIPCSFGPGRLKILVVVTKNAGVPSGGI
jgi:hypothetical protein